MTADDYLREVEFTLNDLPWRQRRELVAELRAHLAELPAETNFRERLGQPVQYAADLRAAAGLERRRGPIAFLRARRPRNLVIAVLAVVLLGLAISTAVWVQTYQPLKGGGLPLLPANANPDPLNRSATAFFRAGRPFELGLVIRNTGRFPVRVLGVPIVGPFRARPEMFGPWKVFDPSLHFETFHPFDLEPGSDVILRLRGVYANCGRFPHQGYVRITGLPVRYSFLWRTSTTTLPLPDALAILAPPINECPAETS